MSTLASILGAPQQNRTVIIYVSASKTVLSPVDGFVRARIMGSGGAGATGISASGGNGATVAFVKVPVSKGDSIVVTIGSGGAGITTYPTPGGTGGNTTVTGPNGLNAVVPGGRGGVIDLNNTPAANATPTGVDEYWLGGLGGPCTILGYTAGGGSAALLEGTSSGFQGGDGAGFNSGAGAGAGIGGPPSGTSGGGSGGTAGISATGSFSNVGSNTYIRLLVPLEGGGGGLPGCGGNSGTSGGFGGGGGGVHNGAGGAGGFGGGGGGAQAQQKSGNGGSGFVTLEFVEV